MIKAEGELVDLCQRIQELSKYEKISLGWKYFNSYITILIDTIPEAKIILRPNQGSKILTYRPLVTSDDTKIEMHDAKLLGNGTNESKNLMEKYFSMDPKILKKTRQLLQDKNQTKNAKQREENLMKQIQAMNLKLNSVMAELMKRK